MRTPNLVIHLHKNNNNNNNNNSNASGLQQQQQQQDPPLSSPLSPHTPNQPSPLHPQSLEHSLAGNPPLSPSLNIPLPPSPNPSNPTRSPKTFFQNPLASRSATRLKQDSPSKSSNHNQLGSGGGAMSYVYGMNKGMGSSPELSATYNAETSSLNTGEDSRSQVSSNNLMGPPDAPNSASQPKKKASRNKFNILGRKQSLRDDELAQSVDPHIQTRSQGVSKPRVEKLKDKSSAIRNRSMDRQGLNEDSALHGNGHHAHGHPSSSIIKTTGSRAVGAAKGLLGKFSKGSGGDTRDPAERIRQTREEEAQKAALTKSYRVVNLPLEQQTRLTRICKRLEDCKDKTEFWLPAVAYRCIDYLNDKGMAHEGLYRVPGSEREIRNWIYRFDTEEDIDLLEEEDLYDVNTISSMFKAWLRDLPDEVFPKSIQQRIVSAVPGGFTDTQGAPDILRTELSNLPPFNYYLLFAVTAHITMLLNASRENKMTFHNLCVCFMPALKMEMPCFSWLILDWKNCWTGCASEREYLNQEYAMQEQVGKEGSTRPLQHFDKYDQPQHHTAPSSRQGRREQDADNMDAQSQKSSLKAPSSARDEPFVMNGRDERQGDTLNVKTSDAGTSQARRPVTSDSSSVSRHKDTDFGALKKEKHRPAPLENANGSDDLSTNGTPGGRRRSKSTNDPAIAGFKSLSDDEKEDRGYAPLELSPVKPLSPFGNLTDM